MARRARLEAMARPLSVVVASTPTEFEKIKEIRVQVEPATFKFAAPPLSPVRGQVFVQEQGFTTEEEFDDE